MDSVSMAVKPLVCFEVEKIIGVSSDGNFQCYQVQWAPAWVSSLHLNGCETLIQEFMQHNSEKDNEPKQPQHLADQLKGQLQRQEFQIQCNSGERHGIVNSQQSDVSVQHKTSLGQRQSNSVQTGDRLAPKRSCFELSEDMGGRKEKSYTCGKLVKSVNESTCEKLVGVPTHTDNIQSTGKAYIQIGTKIDILPDITVPVKVEDVVSGNQLNTYGAVVEPKKTEISNETLKPGIKIENAEIVEDLQHTQSTLSTNWRKMNQVTVGTIDDNGQHMYIDHPNLFAAEQLLENQILIHTDLRVDDVCHKCNKQFHSLSALRAHMRSHQSTNCKSYCCSYCGLTFTNKDDLKRHACENQYPCKFCKKKFISKQSLGVHTKKHRAGFDVIMCEVCNLWFPGLSVLEEHMNTHIDVENTETSEINIG